MRAKLLNYSKKCLSHLFRGFIRLYNPVFRGLQELWLTRIFVVIFKSNEEDITPYPAYAFRVVGHFPEKKV